MQEVSALRLEYGDETRRTDTGSFGQGAQVVDRET